MAQAPGSRRSVMSRPPAGPGPVMDDPGYEDGPMEMAPGAPGEEIFGDEMHEGGYGPGPYDMVGDECMDCGPCDECFDVCDMFCENFSVFGGVQGFKSPTDQFLTDFSSQNNNGNFGFHEGINWGIPVCQNSGIGYQLGGQIVHSDISGTPFSDQERTQYFLTTGLFYRAPCGGGLQGGAVVDFLHDNFFAEIDLAQIRAEVSFVSCGGHEVGFWGAFGVEQDGESFALPFFDSGSFSQAIDWDVIDMYTFFYRRHFCNGSVGRVWAGFTGDGDGVLGADVLAPLADRLALQAGFNYVVPEEDDSLNETFDEVWGMSINLVWFPGYRRCCAPSNPYRPLFNVADNSTFLVEQASHTFQSGLNGVAQ